MRVAPFRLTGLTDAVERLITISQLDTVLNIAYSMEEAVQIIENAEMESSKK